MWAASAILAWLAAPEVVLQLIPSDSGGLEVRLVNTGRREVSLQLTDMESVLVSVPDAHDKRVIHLRVPAASGRESCHLTVVPRGATVVLADVTHHVRSLPRGAAMLVTAVYSVSAETVPVGGAWHGFVRSLPLVVTYSP